MSGAGPLVAVVDYGIGNLHSAQKALVALGADARLTDDAGLIADAVAVVLPGVGAFGACMDALRVAPAGGPRARRGGIGPPVPRHLRRDADAVRRQRRGRRARPASASSPARSAGSRRA